MADFCCLIVQFVLGTCESAVCVRIESGVTIRIRIESAIIIYFLKHRPHWRP